MMAANRRSLRNKKEAFCDLHPEIIEVEILTRLSVKSLVRFRSVCKSWNLLLSENQNFIKSHLVHNPNRDSLILRYPSCYKIPEDYYSILKISTMIIGSTNGLVCLYNWLDEFALTEIAIWNPATKQCKFVLLRKPITTDTCVGFGYDSIADDYKVICMKTIKEKPLKGLVYSCNDNSWRKISPSNCLFRGSFLIGDSIQSDVDFPCYRQESHVIVNGSPYWLTSHKYEKSHLIVMSFDVQHEVPRLLPELCAVDLQKDRSAVLINMKDCVAVMVYDSRLFLSTGIDVNLFDERCCVWNKTFIAPFIPKEPRVRKYQPLLQCFRNGDILFLNRSCELYSFNPQTHTIRRLGKQGDCYNCWSYSESLVSIEGMLPLHNFKEDEHGVFYLTGQ